MAGRAPMANDPAARELRDYGLGRSFRTAQAVLDFVDASIGAIGHAAFGLARPPEPHVGDERPGLVALWQPVGAAAEDDPDEGPDEEAPDTWLPGPERRMADKIAAQVKHWLTDRSDRAGQGREAQRRPRRHHGSGAQATRTCRA